MSEKAQQNAPERCSCCTCGYTWVKGQHGGHSCAQAMEVTVADLRARLATYEGAEGRPVVTGERLQLVEELRAAAYGHPLDFRLAAMSEAADALESQAREIERLTLAASVSAADANDAERELAALKAQPSGVDERAAFEAWYLGHFYMGDKQCGLEWLSTEPCGGYRHQHPAEQWIVWQARAALSAPSHGEQVREASEPVAKALDHAVSAIYFDDDSDFQSALWGVVKSLSPELAVELEGNPSAAWHKVQNMLAAAPSAVSQEQG